MVTRDVLSEEVNLAEPRRREQISDPGRGRKNSEVGRKLKFVGRKQASVAGARGQGRKKELGSEAGGQSGLVKDTSRTANLDGRETQLSKLGQGNPCSLAVVPAFVTTASACSLVS